MSLVLLLSLAHAADVDVADTWDLSAIFPTVEDWEAATVQAETDIDGLASCRGTLGKASSLADCLVRIDGVTGLRVEQLDQSLLRSASVVRGFVAQCGPPKRLGVHARLDRPSFELRKLVESF